MTEAEVLSRTESTYLSLVHPVVDGARYRQDLAPVLAISTAVPKELVASLLIGASWRERLLGLSLAMHQGGKPYVEHVRQSLREPRGIAIVPACAALGVLAKEGGYEMQPAVAYEFDRDVFDGEIAWAIEKALHYAGLPATEVSGNGPNSGQVFEDHVEVYAWLYRQGVR